jgi:uncharacterized protein YjbI with pentapeptide repeats
MNPRTPLLPRLAISLVLAAIIFPACSWRGLRGNGHITTENRTVPAFANIDAGGLYEIEWASGAPSLSITTDENLLSHIQTTVDGDKLGIHSDQPLGPTKSIKVHITSATLSGAQLSGAVRFHGTNLSGPNFFLDTSGAVKIILDGHINSLTASLTGASKLAAESLETQTAELSITGAGAADVWVTDALTVAIQGAGKVTYSGNPKTVKKDIAGAGKVQPR